jgi:hypothetical protein
LPGLHSSAATVVCYDNIAKEIAVFTKLTAELLDLVVDEKGYRLALYAKVGSDGACSCVGCCCCCCK